MSIMEMMREFSVFRQNKEVEEMEAAVKEADQSFLKDELLKYVYSEEVVDKLLPALEHLNSHNPEYIDSLFEVFKFKEEEIAKLVEHKDKFEQQASQEDQDINTDSQEETEHDYVLEYVTNNLKGKQDA